MGVITVAWWALFVVCVVGLARTRLKKRAERARTSPESDAGDEPAEALDLGARPGPRLPTALRGPDAPPPAATASASATTTPPSERPTTTPSPKVAAPALPEPAAPALPVAPIVATRSGRSFAAFDREVLSPVLRADIGAEGVRCPACGDGSIRRYLHRSPTSPGEIEGDVWCTACRRHVSLSGPGDDLEFEDPLDHLDDVRRAEIARDLDDYLGGLDVLWTQGKLPQTLRRGAVRAP